ncbi:S49 family peptidase [Thiothrix subterranea]|uniref:S49 family peptidase n=1 Tax=Thiothrix subterranea TaxID=2735563 RepID=A0AA51MQ20_9GAMM|nr:S49 family peptidase [Thiothrix subterranea]MDQ5768923.1 S49 family peptidase [Thiothrix subterranea]WML86161.1 S49 family peptidase [Thiothrix subterranea]
MNEENTQALQALKDVAMESVKEQRRARRWGIFFKLFFVAYLLIGLIALIGSGASDTKLTAADKITAVVDINGVIMDGAEASGEMLIPALKEAFEHEKTKGVILRINSPGGSPVQSGIINDEIKRLKAKYKDIPVYAVVSDLCASGGYYIAVAADEIYADKASIVGSIGVRMDNFGAVELLEKLGVERRLYTAGANKGMLDPFLPENATQVAHVNNMLNTTHQQFIKVVKEGRDERLPNNPDIFSGLFWTGEDAVKLGLIDGLGSDAYVARELIKAEEMVNFTTEKDLIQRLSERVETSVQSMISLDATPRTVLR